MGTETKAIDGVVKEVESADVKKPSSPQKAEKRLVKGAKTRK